MCGIVGYLGNRPYLEYIIAGLRLLQNRGYDSVGVSSIDSNHKLETVKHASTDTHNSLTILESELNTKPCTSNIAIGHTRWATHGGKTKLNAHPHTDNNERISLVHNGIIENYQLLKHELISEGYHIYTQTDTEIVAIMIGKYLDTGFTMKESIEKTTTKLTGTWALVIIDSTQPNKIWATRNGSPLLIGIQDNIVMIVSEEIAFQNYINQYIILENNDIFEITHDGNVIESSEHIQRYPVKENKNGNSIIATSPGEYTHWMLKEIMEQPSSITRAINNGGRIASSTEVMLGGLNACKKKLLDCNHLIILGCGTSLHAGLWAIDLFKMFDIFDTVGCYDGADFDTKDIPKKGKVCIIMLSQSGETKDLHRCIKIAKDYDLITIGVVNVVDSMIARETDCGIYMNAGREVAVASTKSFTNQCVILSMISIWFSQNRGTAIQKRRNLIDGLRNLSMHVQTVLEQTTYIREQVDNKFKHNSVFLLGKGCDEAIAKEGALKLKEITYLHAEGYSSSALKHGPFALIEPGLPIILLDTNPDNRSKIMNAYQEVSARNASVIIITDCEFSTNNEENVVFKVNPNRYFAGLVANIYIQLASYYYAISNDINPDYPRNLAKVVSVE